MSELVAHSLTISINDILNRSSSTPSEHSIFKVANHLRRINPKAYDPKVIAIGPFHRGKPHLQDMEHHKHRYLRLLLERKQELRVEDFGLAMIELEERAWKCYAGDIGINRGEFVKMLILDACFILEFLRQFRDTERNGPIFQIQLFHDLMVFENQIPFFVVKHLFDMTKDNGETINELIWHVLVNGIFDVKQLPEEDLDGPHLLGIVYHVQCSNSNKVQCWLFADIHSAVEQQEAEIVSHKDEDFHSADGDLHSDVEQQEAEIVFQNDEDYHSADEDFHSAGEGIHSAVQLKETGIAFKKSKGNSLFHIQFRNKTMIIPAWKIYDETESLFRNLIAYEQYLTGDRPKRYVSDYVFLMQCLIRSIGDAKLLRHSGIISTRLGDKTIYGLISQLGKNIETSDEYSYWDIFYSVNQHCKHTIRKKKSRRYHCKRTMNKWMEKLRRDYFDSPWSIISLFAAVALLALTTTQTTFAILSYRNDLKNGNTTLPQIVPKATLQLLVSLGNLYLVFLIKL